MVLAALLQAAATVCVIVNTHVYKGTNGSFTELPGEAKAIDVTIDDAGVVWMIDEEHKVYSQTPTGWKQAGDIRALRIAAFYTVWVIGSDNAVYTWNKSTWNKVGSIKGIDIAMDGINRPWVIGLNGEVYYYHRDTWNEITYAKGKKITVLGERLAYIIGPDDGIYMVLLTKAAELPGNMKGKDLGVSKDGFLWVVDLDGVLWYYKNQKWTKQAMASLETVAAH